MKRFFKKTAYLIGTTCLAIAMVSFIQSCNKEEEKPSGKTEMSEEVLRASLFHLADAQRGYIKELLKLQKHVTRASEESDSIQYEYLRQAADSIFVASFNGPIYSNFLATDLSQQEIDALNLSDDDMELYKADPYAYLQYAEHNKSHAFSSYLSSCLDGEVNPMSITTIVNSTELKQNEKVSLILTEVCAEELVAFQFDDTYVIGPPTNKKCMEQFTIDQGLCLGGLLAAAGVEVGKAAASGGLFSLWSAVDLLFDLSAFKTCIELAKANYHKCIKEH